MNLNNTDELQAMTMRLIIRATRNIYIPAIDKIDTQVIRFDAWDPNSRVAYSIANDPTPIESYKNWVMSKSKDTYVTNYSTNPPTEKIVDYSAEHVLELDVWLSNAKIDGYTKIEVVVE